MPISAERAERLATAATVLTPGRLAGRMVDGVDLIIDGEPAGRMEARWICQLETAGYERDVEGEIAFEILVDGKPRRSASDIREALYEALALIAAGRDPDRIRIDAVTSSGRRVDVVGSHPIIGMAIGALQDEPITVIEGPSVLPRFAPGERPAKRARSPRGAPSRA